MYTVIMLVGDAFIVIIYSYKYVYAYMLLTTTTTVPFISLTMLLVSVCAYGMEPVFTVVTLNHR